jgi:hypothetical protein
MYKCHACGKQFVGGERLDSKQIWQEYQSGKQTLLQLSKKYNCSKRTIQRKLDLYWATLPEIVPRRVIILMDTTYWGRRLGVMLFKDSITKENLLKYYVRSETNALYRKGIEELKSRGFSIIAIVCDGRRGLLQSFEDIPVQMCQFHQVAIIRRYITKKPRMLASMELKAIVKLLVHTDKESFTGALDDWFSKWEGFLNERTTNSVTGKRHYTHKRLRSAYRSLKNNLLWLFTWYDNIELNIPNTTNAIDGHFANLKTKMRNHNGLSPARKRKFIDGFLKA